MKKYWKTAMAKIFLFLFLSICSLAFCISPRVFVTFGPDCDFSAEQLQKHFDAVLVSGSSKEIKKKMECLDKHNSKHVLLLSGAVSDLEDLSRHYGYALVNINCKFEDAVNKLHEMLAAIPCTDADLPHLHPTDMGIFYDLMIRVDRIFKANNIRYWATCGTLLGAVRHKGMIPWDDDIDIAIFEEDIPRLLKLNEALAREGLDIALHPKYGFFKIFFKNGQNIFKENGGAFPWKYPLIDVFPLTKVHRVYTYSAGLWRQRFKKRDHYSIQDLQHPLSTLSFGPLEIPVPHRPVKYLKRMYGKDWNDVAYVTFSHKHEQQLPKVKVDLINRASAPYILGNGF